MDTNVNQASLQYHRLPRPGKIEVVPTKALETQRDLALAYTPGVAAACTAIVDDPKEVWCRPDQSAFYVRNTQGLEYTLYRNEAALDEDDDHPDVIHLTELAWHLLGYIDVDKLTSEILLPWFPEACYEDDEESDIEWGESTREWLAHSMFNLEC